MQESLSTDTARAFWIVTETKLQGLDRAVLCKATAYSRKVTLGHINNVQYYSYFDTAVNRYLIEQGVLDIHKGEVIGLVVETHCNYFSSAAFPDDIEAGIRVAHLGRSSVRYEIGLFIRGREEAIAQGHFVHVYVDRETQKSVEIPDDLRSVLSALI